MGGQPSWQNRPDQRQSPQPTTMSESSDVMPPADDETRNPFKRPQSPAQPSRVAKAGEPVTRLDEPRPEVFDLTKMSPHDIAVELARRSKPSPVRAAPTEAPVSRDGEHLSASGLSDDEVAAFFAPLPRLFQERREHDHSDPAYAALRAKMTEAAAEDAADEHDPMDALSRALETRLAARPSVEKTMLADEASVATLTLAPAGPTEKADAVETSDPKTFDVKRVSAAEKISALMEKSAAEKLATGTAPKVIDDFTIPPMPSQLEASQLEPGQQGGAPIAPQPFSEPQSFSASLPESLMASPLHIPALSLSVEKDAVGLPLLRSRMIEADKAFIEPVLRKPAKPAAEDLDIEQSISAALAEKTPGEEPIADLSVGEAAVPAAFRAATELPPIIVDEPMALEPSAPPVKRSSIRLVKRSGKAIPLQSLLERLRGQPGSFRWDILAGGIVIGAILAAIPVMFLMPSHAPVVLTAAPVNTPDEVAAATAAPGSTGSAQTTPVQTTPVQAETIVPSAPLVPTLGTVNNAGSTDDVRPALTPAQADKLLQSAQSMSTAAGGTTADAPATPTDTAAATTGSPTSSAAVAPQLKPGTATTTKKPATTKKKTKKPATDQQLSPAKR